MKYTIITAALLICAALSTELQSQTPDWNTSGNFVNPGYFLGSTNNANLDLRQYNILRARFINGTFAGYNGQAALNNVNRIHLSINGNLQTPFSLLHMGYNIDPALSRPWMNVGTTMGAGRDIMHVGLLQGPAGSTDSTNVDAVVAWGCNDQIWSPANGPDNLRFLFLAPSDVFVNTPGRNPEGLETMRITPWGNIGMGNSFTNTQQPARRLVVHEEDEDPQLRIAHTLNADVSLGANADFQVSAAGDLYIKPTASGNVQGVAIGFLEGEQSAPTSPLSIQTMLDVSGLTRSIA